jgi:hypothetical protein
MRRKSPAIAMIVNVFFHAHLRIIGRSVKRKLPRVGEDCASSPSTALFGEMTHGHTLHPQREAKKRRPGVR